MKLSLRARTQPEVNLTSLIDVVLLLLIFFMVSTSFVKQSQINISLPQADSSTIVEEPAEQIDIMITATGTYLVNGRELINNRPETIRNALQKISGGDTSLPLTISGEPWTLDTSGNGELIDPDEVPVSIAVAVQNLAGTQVMVVFVSTLEVEVGAILRVEGILDTNTALRRSTNPVSMRCFPR